MKHIDEWIGEPEGSPEEKLVKEWFNHYRLAEVFKDYKWLSDREISCEWEGQRYRCTGCSRLGDVWLTKDFGQIHGYQKRVNVDSCSGWKMTTSLDAGPPVCPDWD